MLNEIFTSEIFTFVIGEEAREIMVHSGAIARLSPALNMLIRGPYLEAREKTVRWDDLEREDFLRLCQFAYAGDYSIEATPEPPSSLLDSVDKSPEPATPDAALSNGDLAPQEDDVAYLEPRPKIEPREERRVVTSGWGNAWDDFGASKKSKKKSKAIDLDYDIPQPVESNISKARRRFNGSWFPESRTWNNPDDLYAPVASNHSRQAFSVTFLAHARLCVLGNKYEISNLSSLALNKLHKALIALNYSRKYYSGILELVRYVYHNTQERSADPLRGLVVSYVISISDQIGSTSEFHLLLAEGGDFVRDFWEGVRTQLL